MSWIINIDTAIEGATISIAENGQVLAYLTSEEQRDHAAFMQPAIQQLLATTQQSLPQIDAIAVSAGPGSYTGLRVGYATAKGLCYALQKPLIAIPTLQLLAWSAIQQNQLQQLHPQQLINVMIDARRMEVYTATFNMDLQEITPPAALILTDTENANALLNNIQFFTGNGAAKWQRQTGLAQEIFLEASNNPLFMSQLAHQYFERKQFEDVAYSEPFYLKDFYTTIKPTP